MSTPSTGAQPGTAYRGLLLAVAVSTAAIAAMGTPNPILAVVPVALATMAFVVLKVPLRWSCSALILLMLVPDTNHGSWGQWRTPLAVLGDAIHQGIGPPVSGAEAIALFLTGVALHRGAKGVGVAPAARTEAAQVAVGFMVLSVAGLLYAEIFGLLRGLPAALWKVRALLQPVLLGALFLAAFRERRDHLLIGRIIVASAFIRSILAFVVQRIAVAQTGGPFSYATSHGDSALFSVAVALVLADLALRPSRARLMRAFIIVPVILIGAIANGRRTFWVMILITLVAGFLLVPMNRWKRSLTRVLVLALPVLIIYVGVGWERTGRMFAPVQTIRSVIDTSSNRSSYWRDVENWNVARSMRDRPLTGVGLGGQYVEFMPNDDISMFYKEYRELPHNSLLGMMFLMGPVGYTAYFALLSLVCFLSLRSYWRTKEAGLMVAAFGCLSAIIACLVLAYGDIGLVRAQYNVLLALAIAVSARLSVATGAWPSRTTQAA
jgi:O-antigen ligase